jgi:2-polyprenyl-3-methyl-5-hydroxy-6-metoxy-1,4-benzoquinol methylase
MAGRSVVDVGGGASLLVDRLLEQGVTDVTVVDIAAWALQVSRDRLGPAGASVRWLVRDVVTWRPERTFDVWHDRAVFHFLVDPADRAAYRRTMYAALAPTGSVVIGTFADDGPSHCSGLPVACYSPEQLAAEFPDLRVVGTQREEHHTPTGGVQPFTWLVLSR